MTTTVAQGSDAARRPSISRPLSHDTLGCELWPIFVQEVPGTWPERLKQRSYYLGLSGLPAFIRKLLDWREYGYTETGSFEAETMIAGLAHGRLWVVRQSVDYLVELEARATARATEARSRGQTKQQATFTSLAREFHNRAIRLAMIPPPRGCPYARSCSDTFPQGLDNPAT